MSNCILILGLGNATNAAFSSSVHEDLFAGLIHGMLKYFGKMGKNGEKTHRSLLLCWSEWG